MSRFNNTSLWNRRAFAAAFIVAAFAPSSAAADAPLYAKQACDPVTQSARAFHECYAANLDAANRALAVIYKKLLAQKNFYVGNARSLRDVERAWIVYKDGECKYEYGDADNENFWLARADCEIRVTEQRIRELRARPSCTGGDSVCYPHMR
jgi:uncharacterized protein YecT (DUF1311 family)